MERPSPTYVKDHRGKVVCSGLFQGVGPFWQLTFRPKMEAKGMTLGISFQPIRVLIDGHDADGRLILADGQLTAVIVRLDGPTHGPEHKGRWHLEAGFGKCHVRKLSLFRTPEEAGAWVERVLMREAISAPWPSVG